MQIAPSYQKKIFIAQKVCNFVGYVEISVYSKNHCGAILIVFGDTQFFHTFLAQNQAQKLNSWSQLHAQRSKSHSNSFGIIRVKIHFVELYKEGTICANLRVNTPIYLAATEAKTCLAMLCRGSIIMQIPRGYQKKMFIAQKVCNFVGNVEISVYSKNHCGAILIVFGDTQFVHFQTNWGIYPKDRTYRAFFVQLMRRTFQSDGPKGF